jgi:hypothetical protein
VNAVVVVADVQLMGQILHHHCTYVRSQLIGRPIRQIEFSANEMLTKMALLDFYYY